MTREGGPGPPLLWGLHASMSRAVGTMCRLCGDFINSSGHHCISSPCRHLMALVTSHNEDGKRGSAGRNLTVVRLHCKSRLIHTHTKKNISRQNLLPFGHMLARANQIQNRLGPYRHQGPSNFEYHNYYSMESESTLTFSRCT